MTDEAQSSNEQKRGHLELKNTSLRNEREALLALKAVRAGNTVDDVEIQALREDGEASFKQYHGITDPEQAEPQQRQGEKPSPSRLASEMFGDDFKGEVKTAEGEQDESQEGSEADASATTDATSSDDAALQWSDRDMADVNQHQTHANQIAVAAQQQQQIEAEFNQKYAGLNLTELERTDRARAVQIRSDANTILQRRNQIIQEAQRWQGNENTIVSTVQKRRAISQLKRAGLTAEREMAARQWLVAQGYTVEEVNGARDMRAIIAVDKMLTKPKGPPPPVPLPKGRRKRSKGGKRSVSQGRASNFARADDEQLRQRMHHGSIEAALELMGRKNERRARR